MRHAHLQSLEKMQRDDAANIRCIGRLTCLSGSQVELAPFMFRQTKEMETDKLTLLRTAPHPDSADSCLSP